MAATSVCVLQVSHMCTLLFWEALHISKWIHSSESTALPWVLEKAKFCVYPLKVAIWHSSLAPTNVIPIGLQSQMFWRLSFWYRTPWLRSSILALDPSLGDILHNYLFCHFWVTHQSMWILTILCLQSSHAYCFGFFFIFLVVYLFC